MRFGLLSCVAVAVSLVSMTVAQPSEAHKTGKRHHHHRAAASPVLEEDIVVVATNAGTFKELTSELQAAGLVGALKGPGPFTVFAPDDAAFAQARSENKLAGDKDKLANVLKYHVVKGNISSADLASKRSLTTLQGESLMINAKDGKVIVDGAMVTKPDIKAGNGVIHVIDAVVIPERGK